MNTTKQTAEITEVERKAVYKTIYGRRDTRSFFKREPVPQEILARILRAAHHAGSVGCMQPWNFIVVEDTGLKQKVKKAFEVERNEAALLFEGEKREKHLSYKLEGITEAPVYLLVTSDPTRFGPQVIGRHSMPETDVYSTCLAIQNLWLAAPRGKYRRGLGQHLKARGPLHNFPNPAPHYDRGLSLPGVCDPVSARAGLGARRLG